MAPNTKANLKRLDAAATAFHARYAAPSQWGEQRWASSLYPALAQPTIYTAVINQYAINEAEALSVLSGPDTGVLSRVRLPPVSGVPKEQEQDQTVNRFLEITCFEKTPSTIIQNGESEEIAVAGSSLTTSFPVPKPVPSTKDQLLTHWNMDAASVLAAHMLDVEPGDRVLDMCAAPGGKSVVLAQKLFPHLHRRPHTTLIDCQIGILHANEYDQNRHKRLSTNLKSYLDSSLFPTAENPYAPVRVLNKDLSTKQSVLMLPLGINGYDKVLIDAPCSSERHIIHAYEKAKMSGQVADEMLNWKSSRVTTLTKTQTGLLQTALKAVKLGGKVVYATCALGEEENDGVVAKVLDALRVESKKAKRENRQIESWDISFLMGTKGIGADGNNPVLELMTEKTKFGRIALPDHAGWGPLYFCIMVKRPKMKKSKHESRMTTNATLPSEDE